MAARLLALWLLLPGLAMAQAFSLPTAPGSTLSMDTGLDTTLSYLELRPSGTRGDSLAGFWRLPASDLSRVRFRGEYDAVNNEVTYAQLFGEMIAEGEGDIISATLAGHLIELRLERFVHHFKGGPDALAFTGASGFFGDYDNGTDVRFLFSVQVDGGGWQPVMVDPQAGIARQDLETWTPMEWEWLQNGTILIRSVQADNGEAGLIFEMRIGSLDDEQLWMRFTFDVFMFSSDYALVFTGIPNQCELDLVACEESVCDLDDDGTIGLADTVILRRLVAGAIVQ